MKGFRLIRSFQMSEFMNGKHLVHYHVQNEQDYDQNDNDVVMMQRLL